MARTSIATDDFNRASLGANWTQTNVGNAGSISIDSSTRIVGQYGVQPTNEIAEAVWAGTGSFTADQYGEVTLINPLANGGASNRHAAAARMSGTGASRSLYMGVVQQDSATTPTTYIAKVVSGTITILYSAAQAWAANDKLSIECQGTTIRLCRNGTPLGGGFTLTDSGVSTGTPGAGATIAAYADAWEGGNITTAAPVLSSPTGSATGPTQATIGVTSDTAPTTTAISYQILPAATGAPSAATIVGAPDGTISTGSAGALTKAITGLTTNTAVKVHFAQGTTSNVVSSASFTPNTLASSGSPSAQTGTASGSITWAGATPDSFVTNHGNGSGAWSIVSSAGFTVAPSINTSTGVLSGGTLASAGTYAPQIRYTDSSTVPSAQQINFTLSLTVSGGGGGTVYGFKFSAVAGLQFGNIVGALTGLGLRPAGEQYVATVHDASDHSTIVAQSGALTMGAGGRLPDFSHASIANATSYFVSFRRVSDGATCSALLTSEAVP